MVLSSLVVASTAWLRHGYKPSRHHCTLLGKLGKLQGPITSLQTSCEANAKLWELPRVLACHILKAHARPGVIKYALLHLARARHMFLLTQAYLQRCMMGGCKP